jgi:hypothetical protein
MEAVLVAQSPGFVYQCGEYGLLIGWVVMRAGIQVEVGMGRFMVYTMAEGTIGYVPPKRQLHLNRLHGVTSQKMILFITTAVKTSNHTMGQYLEIGHDHFLPHPFQFIVHQSPYHPTQYSLSH